jgi:predicted lysophospholipase L1 biosynthesis ABC-type transport system permease subunit
VTQVLMRGQRIDLLSLQKVKGTVAPTYIAGRAPESTREIALGARTMRKLHISLGDAVTATIGDASASFRVVGRAVFPEFGDAGQLGTGGYVTLGGLDRILSASPSNRNFTGAPRNVFAIRFTDHTNLAAERKRVSDALEPLPHRVEGHPADLADLERVSALPELFSGILTALAVILLVHTLVTSVRRRRRELAVLEAIGFVRRQVRTSVVVHAITLIGVGLLIGIPLGVVAGRTVWKGFAYGLGVASAPVVPLRLVGIAIAASLAIAALAALVPAWLATRRQPAFPLRTAAE